MGSVDEMVFRWTTVPGSRSYIVHVLDGDGDLIWRTEVVGSEVRLDSSVALARGEYFVQVRAQLSDDKTLRSPHVRFLVEPEP
jgi:hypothetical protein